MSVRPPTSKDKTGPYSSVAEKIKALKERKKKGNPFSSENKKITLQIKKLEQSQKPVSQKFTGTGKTIGDKKTKTGQFVPKPKVLSASDKRKIETEKRAAKDRLKLKEQAKQLKIKAQDKKKAGDTRVLESRAYKTKPKKKVPYQKMTSPGKAMTKKKDKPSSSPSLWKQFGSAAKKLFGDDPEGAVSLGTASPDDSAEIKRRREAGVKKLNPRALEVASSKKAAVDKRQAELELARKRSLAERKRIKTEAARKKVPYQKMTPPGKALPKKKVPYQKMTSPGKALPKKKVPSVGGEKPGMIIGSQVGKRKPAIKGIADPLAVGPKPKPQTLEQKLKAKFVEKRGGEGAFGKGGSDAAWQTNLFDMRGGSEVGKTYTDQQNYEKIMEERKEATAKKRGGRVGKKKQGYKARKDESIAMRVKKKRTKKQLKASRSDSYGKFGSGKGKGKINRSGAALVAASYD